MKRKKYEKYPEDTFENTLDVTESGSYYYIHSLGYTATHTSDPAHTVSINTTYKDVYYSVGDVMLIYDFLSSDDEQNHKIIHF